MIPSTRKHTNIQIARFRFSRLNGQVSFSKTLTQAMFAVTLAHLSPHSLLFYQSIGIVQVALFCASQPGLS